MKLIRQTSRKSCNIACIRMVLDHLSIPMTAAEIRKRLPKHAYGSTLEEIGDFLQEQGVRAARQPAPGNLMIVSVKRSGAPHYVVAQMTEGGILVYDPLEMAARSESVQALAERLFDGYLIIG